MRDAGLVFVNPFTRRRKVSVRLRNHETAVAKVNDADGNPIERPGRPPRASPPG